jgi:hypothetical protein
MAKANVLIDWNSDQPTRLNAKKFKVAFGLPVSPCVCWC